jgi:hypothetical protein
MFKSKMFVFGTGLIVLFAACLGIAQSLEGPFPFSISNDGALLFLTGAGLDSVNLGFASILPDAGSVTPSGMARLSLRRGGILVSETTIPALPTAVFGISNFLEVDGTVNTGIAFANPGGETATISINLSSPDIEGFNTGFRSFTLPPHSQISRFITEPPFNAPVPFRGQLRWISSVPVSMIPIRGLINERSDFLMTTLLEPDPVTRRVPPSGEPEVVGFIPHFAVGGGWSTQIIVSAQFDEPTSGTIQFFGQGAETGLGEPTTITVNGSSGSTIPYALGFREVQRFVTSGGGSNVRVGSIRVTTNPGFRPPSVMAVFRFRREGITVTVASVPMVQPGELFNMYVDQSGDFQGQVQTGIAIHNPSTLPVSVSLRLTDLNGHPTGLSTNVVVPPLGQTARFLTEFPSFSTLPFPFRGVLEISVAPSERISVIGLYGRYNERSDFLVTTAATMTNIDSRTDTSSARVLPLLVNGGGYSSEFVLLGGGPSGTVRLFSTNGTAFGLTRGN